MAEQSTQSSPTLPSPLGNSRIHDPKLYKPSPALWDAVQVALLLEQPLLVTGDPGTGKTELARHIAYYYDLGDVEIFNAKTTSAANDLFYKYDALGHFQHSHSKKADLALADVERLFVRYQALGKAIQSSERIVVLIDEIDKAPRDLPNDILAAIDRMEFNVPELDNKPFRATKRPIVVLTSNSEKNLPDAFLRRVAYFHIQPPSSTELLQILQSKVGFQAATETAPEIPGYNEAELDPLVAHFKAICESKSLQKNPATAELIHWVSLLHYFGFQPAVLEKERLGNDDRAILLKSYSVLAKTKDDLKTLAEQLKRL
ncbi:MAG: MoxR family ATPase [Phycisphaerae bacterium]|nr:MoxR family ATPase [Saprospiraceae bacterium]